MKFFLSLLLSTALLASSANIDDLFNLSLEELMDVEVTTVSQKKEKANKSSAVVSVITAKQIEEWGVHSVYEALSYLPSVTINETYMGYSVVTFRGVTPGLYNTKVLFMINGHPVHERLFSSSHAEYVPLEVIKRIEVVRSPASVLYGSNAISGVVNIITKRDDAKSQVAARTGSYEHYYGSASIQEKGYTFSGSIVRDSGYDYSGTFDENGVPVNKKNFNNMENFFADIYGDSWSIQASYFNLNEMNFAPTPDTSFDGSNDLKSFYLDINKNFQIGHGQLDLWLRYDNFEKDLKFKNFPTSSDEQTNAKNTVDRYSAKIQYNQSLSYDLSYILGLDYEQDYSTPFVFVDASTSTILVSTSPYTQKQSFTNLATFLQVSYALSEKLDTVMGIRLEKNSDYGLSNPFPRLGFTYEVSDAQYIKVLYSEAFRTPNYLEKHSDFSVIKGDENLNPEHIRTLDISYDAQINERNSLAITLFFLQLDEEITRDATNQYINANGRDVYGLETQYFSVLADDLELMLNLSLLDGKDNETGDALKYIANYTMNAILTYRVLEHIKLSISDQQIGAKQYELNSGEIGKIDAYNLANIMVKYTLGNNEMMLQGKNIFNVDYTYPEQVRKNIAALPGGAGRTVYLTYRYKF